MGKSCQSTRLPPPALYLIFDPGPVEFSMLPYFSRGYTVTFTYSVPALTSKTIRILFFPRGLDLKLDMTLSDASVSAS